MNKAIFLDRDGVINKARIENGFAYSPRKFKDFEIINGVKEAIINFKNKDYLVIVVTNQPEVSRELLKAEELEKMHSYIKNELDIDDIMVCYHDDRHNCNCRKPKPGMLLEAAKKWDVNFGRSFLVGDRWRDIEAGKAADCKTILIKNGASGDCKPDYIVTSLLEATNLV